MGSPAAIRASGLTRAFAALPVLAGVDLAVDAGELCVLLGPNGAGKTTLLRVLAMLLRADAGSLALFGEDPRVAGAALRARVGYAGHDSACYPDLTAAENLAFYADLFAVPQAPARIAELLDWCGLEAAARRPVRTYSRGMQQRLALARALLHRPALLLLDEPFSGLDPTAADALATRLAALRDGGAAIVLTTHELDRVGAIATRTVILDRGRIVWSAAGAADQAAYQRVVGGRG